MFAFAVLSVIIGGLIYFYGAFWMIYRIFTDSVLFGLGALIFWPVQIVWMVLNWDEAKEPLVFMVLGWLIFTPAIVLLA